MNLQEFKSRLEVGSLLTEIEVEALATKTIELLAEEPNVVEVEGLATWSEMFTGSSTTSSKWSNKSVNRG